MLEIFIVFSGDVFSIWLIFFGIDGLKNICRVCSDVGSGKI